MVWSDAEADMHEMEQARDRLAISTRAMLDEAQRQPYRHLHAITREAQQVLGATESMQLTVLHDC